MICQIHSKVIKYIAISENSAYSDENPFLCEDCAFNCQQKDKSEKLVPIFGNLNEQKETFYISKKISRNVDNVVKYHHNLVSEFNNLINDIIEELVKRLIVIKHTNYKLIENWMKENEQKVNQYFFSKQKIKTLSELSQLIQQKDQNTDRVRTYYNQYQKQSKTVNLISTLRYNLENVNYFKTYLQQIKDVITDFDRSFKPKSVAFFASRSSLNIDQQMNQISQQFTQQQANYHEFMLKRIQDIQKQNQQSQQAGYPIPPTIPPGNPFLLLQNQTFNQQAISNLQSTPINHNIPLLNREINLRQQPNLTPEVQILSGSQSQEVQNVRVGGESQKQVSQIQSLNNQLNNFESNVPSTQGNTPHISSQQIEIVDSDPEKIQILASSPIIQKNQKKNSQSASSLQSSSSKKKATEVIKQLTTPFSSNPSLNNSNQKDLTSQSVQISFNSEVQLPQQQQIISQEIQSTEEVSKNQQIFVQEQSVEKGPRHQNEEENSQCLAQSNVICETNLQRVESCNQNQEGLSTKSKEILISIENACEDKNQDNLSQETNLIIPQEEKEDKLPHPSDSEKKSLKKSASNSKIVPENLQNEQNGQQVDESICMDDNIVMEELPGILDELPSILSSLPQMINPIQQQLESYPHATADLYDCNKHRETLECDLFPEDNLIQNMFSSNKNQDTQPLNILQNRQESPLHNEQSQQLTIVNFPQIPICSPEPPEIEANPTEYFSLNGIQIDSNEKPTFESSTDIIGDLNKEQEQKTSQNQDSDTQTINQQSKITNNISPIASDIIDQSQQQQQQQQQLISNISQNQTILDQVEINDSQSPSLHEGNFLKEQKTIKEIQKERSSSLHIVRESSSKKSSRNEKKDSKKCSNEINKKCEPQKLNFSMNGEQRSVLQSSNNSSNVLQNSSKDKISQLLNESRILIAESQDIPKKPPSLRIIKKGSQSKESTLEKVVPSSFDLPSQCVKRNQEENGHLNEETYFKEPSTKKKIFIEVSEEQKESQSQSDSSTQENNSQVGKVIWFKNLKIIRKQDGSLQEQVKFKQFNSEISDAQSKTQLVSSQQQQAQGGLKKEGFSKRVIHVETIMKKDNNQNLRNDSKSKEKQNQFEESSNWIDSQNDYENSIKIFKKKFVSDKKINKC